MEDGKARATQKFGSSLIAIGQVISKCFIRPTLIRPPLMAVDVASGVANPHIYPTVFIPQKLVTLSRMKKR
ncbi:MAG TPA: hypothetical protein VEB88_04760 [Candidatus Acidoferrales bacterium]|nr:hypothetical protein [Candidatus Acidoferrales bacterium]